MSDRKKKEGGMIRFSYIRLPSSHGLVTWDLSTPCGWTRYQRSEFHPSVCASLSVPPSARAVVGYPPTTGCWVDRCPQCFSDGPDPFFPRIPKQHLAAGLTSSEFVSLDTINFLILMGNYSNDFILEPFILSYHFQW